jgi:hypothetical protein
MEEQKSVVPVEQANAEIVEMTKKIGTLKTDIQKAIDTNGTLLKRCVSAGDKLLARAESEQMCDALDDEIATYIEGAKKAYKMMGDTRKPQTQVLDLIKKGFTTMESLVYVKNPDSVVCKLQKKRDEWAAFKLEQQRKAEEERQRLLRIEQEKTCLANETKRVLNQILDESTQEAVSALNQKFAYITLDNKEQVKNDIETFIEELPLGTIFVKRQPRYSQELADADAKAVMNAAYKEVKDDIVKSYAQTVKQTKEDLLMKFDSKVAELEEIRRKAEEERKAAEEREKAARDEAEKEAARKAKEEAERKAKEEEERLRKADEEAAKAQQEAMKKEAEAREAERKINAASGQAADLFNQASSVITPVKAKVSKKIEVLNMAGWQEVIAAWWTYEGAGLDMEKLETKLGFMKRAVEREVNKKDLTLESPNLRLVDDVTAK